MVIVDYDGNDVVKFYCDKCDFHGEYDVQSVVSDNCAVDIDVMCELCGDIYVLYVLKCKDPAQAKELNARLDFLKYKRTAEGKDNGNIDDGSGGSSPA